MSWLIPVAPSEDGSAWSVYGWLLLAGWAIPQRKTAIPTADLCRIDMGAKQ